MKKITNNEIYKSVSPYINLGIQMAVTICLFVFLGVYLDGKFNTSPLWVIVCSISGIAIAMFNFIRTVLKK